MDMLTAWNTALLVLTKNTLESPETLLETAEVSGGDLCLRRDWVCGLPN